MARSQNTCLFLLHHFMLWSMAKLGMLFSNRLATGDS